MRWIICLAVLLSACGQQESEPPNDNHGVGWDYNDRSTAGLRVRYYNDTSIRIDGIERVWYATQDCVGATSDQPLVIFSTDVRTDDGTGLLTAKGWLDTSTTVVFDGVKNDLAFAEHVIRHEFVHLILYGSGKVTDWDAHMNHTPAEFQTCTVSTGLL